MALDWNDVLHFVTLVEQKTLTAAAEVLNVQHSAVSRRVAQLEECLGLRPFERIGKRYLLTEDGARIYDHARELHKDMNALQRLAHERAGRDRSCNKRATRRAALAADAASARVLQAASTHPSGATRQCAIEQSA